MRETSRGKILFVYSAKASIVNMGVISIFYAFETASQYREKTTAR
jgi:hypothetical protein